MRELFWAVVLGVVEGVTEFLPISSTGHLLLCQQWMGIDLEADPFWKMFAIFIQIGAILAVVVYFRGRIAELLRGMRNGGGSDSAGAADVETAGGLPGGEGAAPAAVMTAPVAARAGMRISPVWLVLLATVPVLVVGKLAHGWVEQYMEAPQRVATVVSLALAVGGVLMLLVEWLRPPARTQRLEEITLRQGMMVGCFQVLAVLFPGTSRSAATILGGLSVGLSRHAAAEFSFFLAIPAMFAACGYSLLKSSAGLTAQQMMLLAVGTGVSFVVAWGVIAAFMGYIRTRSFVPFAVYRILLGGFVLLAA